MCRVLAYLGQPVLLDDLLYKPDSSLVRQSYDAKMMPMLNLGGFGMAAWDPRSHEPQAPFIYKTATLPFFDYNLKLLAQKIQPTALLAHIRGVPYSERSGVGAQNLHPFHFEGFKLALAHNGDLWDFGRMRFDLLPHIRPEIAAMVQGTTDSEWMYALVMSQVKDPRQNLDCAEIKAAIEATLDVLRAVRDQNDIHIASPVNLFVCDGTQLVATRYTFDYGCYPDDPQLINLVYPTLWYTFGREYGYHHGEWKMIGGISSYDSVILASEPLTRDVSTWLEVPEYSMLFVSIEDGQRRIATVPLDG